MDTRRIVDIETNEFNQLLDAFIERETAEMGEIDAPLFYEAIERIYEPVKRPTTIELQAQVVDNELLLTLPAAQPTDLIASQRANPSNVVVIPLLSPTAAQST